ncbi:MAG: hypothetical protein P8M53_09150 [Pirellulales bacterium]|nr:hypothetical protein [Pirellulales bacterium]
MQYQVENRTLDPLGMIVTLQHKLPVMPQTKRDHRLHGLALIYDLALATLLAACNDSGKPGTAGNTDAHSQVARNTMSFCKSPKN